MKYAVVVVTGCMLLPLWSLTRDPEPRPRNPFEFEQRAVSSQAGLLHRTYRQLIMLDSLRPKLGTTPGLQMEIDRSAADTLSIRHAEALQEIGAEPMRARVGVFVVPSNYGTYRGGQRMHNYQSYAVFTGVDAAGPWCMVVSELPGSPAGTPVSSIFTSHTRRFGRVTRVEPHVSGVCAWWARYGAPGDSLNEWLRTGGYRYAGAARLEQASDERISERELRQSSSWMRVGAMHRCVAGDEVSCRTVLREAGPRVRNAGYAATMRRPNEYGLNETKDPYLFAALEQEFGAEKFARFWRSDQPVEAAFAGAFGVGMAEWVGDWGREAYGRGALGPRMPAVTWLLSFATVTALFAVSRWVAARRRV